MSNSRSPSVILSSVPKAGVVKRGKKAPLLFNKPFAISIVYDVFRVEMVKCSRC